MDPRVSWDAVGEEPDGAAIINLIQNVDDLLHVEVALIERQDRRLTVGASIDLDDLQPWAGRGERGLKIACSIHQHPVKQVEDDAHLLRPVHFLGDASRFRHRLGVVSGVRVDRDLDAVRLRNVGDLIQYPDSLRI